MQSHAQFRLVRPDHALAMRGLRVLVGGPESAAGILAGGDSHDVQWKVDSFLAYAQTIRLDITRQVLALEAPIGHRGAAPDGAVNGGRFAPHVHRIAGMCLWVPSPGRTAMLFAPSLSEFPETAAPSGLAIEAAQEDARATGVVLAQAMMEPSDAAGKTVFASSGMMQLATLTYMERRPPLPQQSAPMVLPAPMRLIPYRPGIERQLREAILASYQETLDCPAMSGLRDVDDVIEGHKSAGPFDPEKWGLLLLEDKPVGCLLLADIPARRALELVYLGLAPEVRGRGIGRLLMQHVLWMAARGNFELATLAVDVNNSPAVKLYRRCGYASVAQRVAMVKKL